MKKGIVWCGIATSLVLMSCSTDIETLNEIENSERRPQTECSEAVLPIGIDRQDVINRLNEDDVREIGYLASVQYDKNLKGIVFGYLWNGGVQYNFTITDERGDETQGCVTFNGSSMAKIFDFNGRAGNYTVTFDDYPEVTRQYGFEITRGR